MAKSTLVTAIDANSACFATNKITNKSTSFLGGEALPTFTAFATYTTAGSEGAGTSIEMFQIPDNAHVLEMRLTSTALGTSVTLQVGDSGDNDRFIDATSHASAATTTMSGSNPDIIGYKFTAATDITVLTAGATLAGSQTINLYETYIMPPDVLVTTQGG